MTASTGFLKAHKLGRKILKKVNYDRGICSFGIVGSIKNDHVIDGPCHAALRRMDGIGVPQYMVDAIYPYGEQMTDAQAKAYARYVLMESPYSDMFAEKNIEKGWKRRYFLLNTDADSNILVGGAVALRMLSETPDIPLMWNKLVAAGADKHGAFLVAHMTGIDLEGNIYVNQNTDEGHVAIIPTWFDTVSVNNFLNGKNKKYGKYSKKRRYSGFNGMWGEHSGMVVRASASLSESVYEEWTKGIKEFGGGSERRVAIFNHSYNQGDDKSESVNAGEGLPLLVSIINDYVEDTLNA